MEYWWLVVALAIAAVAHYRIVGRNIGILTLDGIFVITQLIMSAGTLAILDPSNRSDILYARIMIVAPTLYITFSVLIYLSHKKQHQTFKDIQPDVSTYVPKVAIISLAAISAFITIAFFQAVGYSTLLIGIASLVNGSSSDITTLRLNSYSDARYLFPGYVNQFKNTILPTLSLVFIIYLTRSRHPLRWLLSGLLIALSLLGLLGTGQRGAFIQFSLAILVFLYYLDRKRFRMRAIIASCALAPMLFVATAILGRSSATISESSGLLEEALAIFREMLKRFVYDNQWSGQMGFRYTNLRPSAIGQEWLQGVLGILPGNSGSSLPRQIFASLYGSDRGTAPPSLWGSVFYNFGWLGILTIPIALAIVYQTISIRAMRNNSINTLELASMSGTFVVLGNWVAGGPEYLLNAGGITFAILWWFGRRARITAQGKREEIEIYQFPEPSNTTV